jgi:hypothetical protein
LGPWKTRYPFARCKGACGPYYKGGVGMEIIIAGIIIVGISAIIVPITWVLTKIQLMYWDYIWFSKQNKKNCLEKKAGSNLVLNHLVHFNKIK